MLLRAALLYVLFVFVILTSGFAVWQSLEVRVRNEKLAEARQTLQLMRGELQAAKDAALSHDRKARIAEHDLSLLQKSQGNGEAPVEDLRAEVAAARQQLSAAETAMTETEARLADEIAAHAALKTKAGELADELAKTKDAVAAAEAKAEAARQSQPQSQIKIEPAPVARIEPPVVTPPATPPAVVVVPVPARAIT
ncbi:MAG: hypothetical protein ABL893_19915, partial [Hyphomicrobium sp.]